MLSLPPITTILVAVLAMILVMILATILVVVLVVVLVMVLVMVLVTILARVFIYRRRRYKAAATEDVGAGHCQSGVRHGSPDHATNGESAGRTCENVPFEVRSSHCRGLGGPPVHVAGLSAVGHDHR